MPWPPKQVEKPFTNCAACGEPKANALPFCGGCWTKQKGYEDRINLRNGTNSSISTDNEPEDLFERMIDGGDAVDWSGLIDQAAERHAQQYGQDIGGEA